MYLCTNVHMYVCTDVRMKNIKNTGKMKNIDHYRARIFGHVYRFLDYLIAMNDNNNFGNSLKEIYPAELELQRENSYENVANMFWSETSQSEKKSFLLNCIMKGMNLIFP